MVLCHSHCTAACNMQHATLMSTTFPRSSENVRAIYECAISCSFYPLKKMMHQRATCPVSCCHVATWNHSILNVEFVDCLIFVSCGEETFHMQCVLFKRRLLLWSFLFLVFWIIGSFLVLFWFFCLFCFVLSFPSLSLDNFCTEMTFF